jgi:hypothetical protein
VTQFDPDLDPVRPGEPAVRETVVTETVETVVVRESNTGWWIAGILGGLVLVAVLWILFSRGPTPVTEDALLEAQADAVAAQAQAQADRTAIAGQVAGAQASVDIARADAARSSAEAARADAEARTAEARAAEPVVIERAAPAVVSPTAPQN